MWGFFQNAPDWYLPQEKARRENIEAVTTTPYDEYKVTPEILEKTEQTRVAPFTKFQHMAEEIAQDEATNPAYPGLFRESSGAIRDALGRDITSRINPYIERATSNPLSAAREYMNPYNQAVIENIGKLGSRNLLENILPNVQDQFVRAGQYGSSRHQDLTNKAIRDTQEAITREQANALRGGYSEALQTAVGQQERQLQGGQLLGGSLGRDIERQIAGGRELQNLSESQQQARQRGAGFLGQIGGLQQQQAQTVRNTAFEDAMRQRDFPFLQASRRAALSTGFQLPTQQQQSAYMPQAPSPSSWTQGAGLISQLSGLAGMAGQRQGFAKGGEVSRSKYHIRHYANGGGVPNNPIQLGVNDALDTTEINFIRDQAAKFAQPQVDPFWSAVMHAGANYAQNPQLGGGLGKLSQAISAGANEYQNQLAHQDQRNLSASKLNSMINETRQWQMRHNLDVHKTAHDIEYNKAKLGIDRAKLGMEQEKHAATMNQKDLIETPRGIYQITKDEAGNASLRNLTPEMEKIALIKAQGKNKDIYAKSNEKAIEEARTSLSSLDALKTNLNELEKHAKKLDTGPIKGRVSRYASTVGDIPIAGKLLAAGESNEANTFDALTNQLVLDLGNQLKGSNIALGKLKIIEASKPQLEKTQKGNLEIISHLKDLADLSQEKANFIIKHLDNGGNAVEAQKAFSEYADAKLKFEEEHPKEKYPNKPDDFINLSDMDNIETSSNMSRDISQYSDDELERIVRGE